MNNTNAINIEREILINHLYDVRALEIAKQNLIKRVNQNSQKIKSLGFHSQIFKPSKISIFISFVITMLLSLTIFIAVGSTLLYDRLFEMVRNESYSEFNNVSIPDNFLYDVVPRHPEFGNYVIISIVISVLLGIAVSFMFSISVFKKTSKYNKMIKYDNQRVEKELNEKKELIQINNDCVNEIKSLNNLLTETYSINIIPRQFRNLAGVYYLYDYMSTSQESLQSALLNYNVNKINIRMDKMIEQQSDMIIQQYVTNSRLEAMQNQNHRIMRQLSNIEQNSEITAKYSAITAANAKAITFFEGYKFLKNDK